MHIFPDLMLIWLAAQVPLGMLFGWLLERAGKAAE